MQDMAYAHIEVAGIITAAGEENKSEAKLKEIKEFATGRSAQSVTE